MHLWSAVKHYSCECHGLGAITILFILSFVFMCSLVLWHCVTFFSLLVPSGNILPFLRHSHLGTSNMFALLSTSLYPLPVLCHCVIVSSSQFTGYQPSSGTQCSKAVARHSRLCITSGLGDQDQAQPND